MELNIDNQKFNIIKLDGESEKIFQERLEFIKKVYQDKKDFKEAVNLSKIWLNFTYNQCRYQQEVFTKLKKYLVKENELTI